MTLGEILSKAAINTLMGMGTVFAVLILISCIIALFRFIPGAQDKLQKKEQIEPIVQSQSTESAVADDVQLVAVIMAAILASKGVGQDALDDAENSPYIVRSIKRKG
ncbi:OadG family protein [Ihubacter sp. rT4E-8]|uniref:OadG family protein n=1 Tax=Ihubacter sp. rT4E-8 TaxID=3242369 RepID=UPI003CF714AA